jgi:hypothetical protein
MLSLKVYKKIHQITKVSIILFSCLFVLDIILRYVLFPIQFTISNLENICSVIILWGCSVSIILALFITLINPKFETYSIIVIFIRFFSWIISIIFILIISFFLSIIFLGVTRVDEELYINKNNSNIKIIEQYYGQGQLGADSPHEILRTNEITPIIMFVSKIDTNNIDKSQWNRVNQ